MEALTKHRLWPVGYDADWVEADSWGERLRAARKRADLTLEQLGEQLVPPLDRRTVSAMEQGRRKLTVELCEQLARALRCDRDWLAGWDEQRNTEVEA